MLSSRESSIGMDVNDVVRRVGLAYWPLIIAMVIVGSGAGGALHYKEAPVYTSDVRFVLDAPDPKAAAESTSIADTAKSIATSPSHVAAALAEAGVNRDVEQFATRNIDLQPLGTSGVMDLQVKDTNPNAAAVIANALASDILSTRSILSDTQANSLINSLTDQIKTVDASLAQVDNEIANYPRSAPNDPSLAAAGLSGLYSDRASLAQERLALETQQDQIVQSMALRPQSSVIDPAVPASQPDPSRAPIDIALGALGGLVVAIMLAALLATMRPRISGKRQIEQKLEAPILGDLEQLDDDVDAVLGMRIRIAATRAGVKHVQLVPLDGSPEAISLVGFLVEKLGSGGPLENFPVPLKGNGQAVARPRRSRTHQDIEVMAFDPSVFSKNGNATETGLVLVAPDVLKRKELDASDELISLTGWAVAGVVVYSRKTFRGVGTRKFARGSALASFVTIGDSSHSHGHLQGLK
jgi:capsular polysaccharide biosynthesis protein